MTPELSPAAVLIPAVNEEASIRKVIEAIPARYRSRVLVVDNGSTDATVERAAQAGAKVVHESRRGYGAACLKGLTELAKSPPELVVFLDADFSDHPDEMETVAGPVERGEADLVIGSRVRGNRERGALSPQARFGNALATTLMRWIYGARFTDLGPFRAVSWSSLEKIQMKDQDFGWTVEMQIKAAKLGLRSLEVPVSYRKRIGHSKISGTLSGSLAAGRKILWLIFRESLPGR